MKKILIVLIEGYQLLVSPLLVAVFGHSCRFHPTCSEFTKVSIEKYGIIKGIGMGLKQLASCHPWSKNYV